MNILLLTAMFLVQAAHVITGGTVTGVVRDTDHRPLVGVRVAAMATPDARGTSTLVGIAVSDETGRYNLEVPAGRYYIVAGRVDTPTYYPGVRGPEDAGVISIASDSAIIGVDLVIFSVGGVVRNPKGVPLAGVRVAAMEASNTAGAPTIISKTDDTGHFRLEVPPGRYYVSAGRVGRSTYYPDTTNVRDAASITVGFGAGTNGLDFLVSDASLEMHPEDLYMLGMERVEFGRYAEARLLLQTFISTYSQNEYFPQAKYAYADSFYREGTPETMALAKPLFEAFLKQFPDAAKAAEARQRLQNIP